MISSKTPLTGCVIALNAEQTINNCVRSLGNVCSEVIVLDSGSTDQTVDLARTAGAITITQDWLGFGPQKNECLKHASHEWILSLDSDEQLSSSLIEEIKVLDLFDDDTSYRIKRENYIGTTRIRHSGWGNDRVIRIFNKKVTQFIDLPVHESVMPTKNIIDLKGTIEHYTCMTIAELAERNNHYGILSFESRLKSGKRQKSGAESAVRSAWSFFRTWVLQLGLLDGKLGFQIACIRAKYTFLKYHGPE
jgi:glycosyltransferase involved in cell wall biosynthesis